MAFVSSSFVLAQWDGSLSQSPGEPVSRVGDELNWPRIYNDNNANIAIYQPEIEKWEGETLETQTAAITPAGTNTAVVNC